LDDNSFTSKFLTPRGDASISNTCSSGAFWSYWFPLGKLGKLEADWEQVDFIFFDEGEIQVHTISMRRVTGFALESPEGQGDPFPRLLP
jgi:hypothetical protein